jgi:hypothetical protein
MELKQRVHGAAIADQHTSTSAPWNACVSHIPVLLPMAPSARKAWLASSSASSSLLPLPFLEEGGALGMAGERGGKMGGRGGGRQKGMLTPRQEIPAVAAVVVAAGGVRWE